jgi:hypothetical protein
MNKSLLNYTYMSHAKLFLLTSSRHMGSFSFLIPAEQSSSLLDFVAARASKVSKQKLSKYFRLYNLHSLIRQSFRKEIKYECP